MPVGSYRAAIGAFYFRLWKHVHKKRRIVRGSCLQKSKKIVCLLKFFLCNVIMIVVYLNLHHSSVMVTNFTSEGDKSNPGPEHFAIKKSSTGILSPG